MRLELTGRHVDITPTLRRLVDTKLAKLERALNDSAMSAHAVLTREKHRHRADITLHARGEKFLHGVGDSGSWETSLSVAIDKITQQAHKIKGKWQERKRRGGKAGAVAALEPGGDTREAVNVRLAPGSRPRRERVRMPRILRKSRQSLRPMTLADAAREIDSGDDGVVVFRDVETSAISVLYRQRNGELTLVETEA
ncbi:MAG TPA: ribosome-associated translation inhibitor RaiA [Vicinamibacterales bacterium]|jgi:putative sigma-54 modulation protein|nr:ribosome-associated translation inhibitor RaiA [Vicinamibacterales bacterium]